MKQKLKLRPYVGKPVDDACQYRRLISKLIYLTITRPDLSYSIQVLSQFIQDPRQPHLATAMRVLC